MLMSSGNCKYKDSFIAWSQKSVTLSVSMQQATMPDACNSRETSKQENGEPGWRGCKTWSISVVLRVFHPPFLQHLLLLLEEGRLTFGTNTFGNVGCFCLHTRNNQNQIQFTYKFSLNICKKTIHFFCNPRLLQFINWWTVLCVSSMVRLFIPVDLACQDGVDNETGSVGGQVPGGKWA